MRLPSQQNEITTHWMMVCCTSGMSVSDFKYDNCVLEFEEILKEYGSVEVEYSKYYGFVGFVILVYKGITNNKEVCCKVMCEFEDIDDDFMIKGIYHTINQLQKHGGVTYLSVGEKEWMSRYFYRLTH